MQHEICGKGPLLNPDGSLAEAGYAKSMLLSYDRSAIKASKLRIKEWDYYLISNGDYALALTVADNAYMGLGSVSLLDLRAPRYTTKSRMTAFPRGSMGLPPSSVSGDTVFRSGETFLAFRHEADGRRHLLCRYAGFEGNAPLDADVYLSDEPEESMVIATPFAGDPHAFYYNQKINCMRASGIVRVAGRIYRFEPETAFAVLDFGRGVWTYRNVWYWSSASGQLDGVPFGFNLGYGFGDTSAASENMLFYNGRAHKLEGVMFNIPKDDTGRDRYLAPWTFTSTDGRFEARFDPVLDRVDNTEALLISSKQHQVFGRFFGHCVLDDGTVLTLDSFPGFAEKVRNRW